MSSENMGVIYAEVRLALNEFEKDGISAQAAMDKLAVRFKQKGEQGGVKYVEGFGNAQKRMNLQLNTMVTSMSSLGPKFGAAGTKVATMFSKPIFTMAPMVKAAFTSMLGVIGPIIAVVTALIGVIAKVVAKNKEKAESEKLSAKTTENLKNITNELADAQERSEKASTKQAENFNSESSSINNLTKSSKELKKELDDVVEEVYAMQNGFTQWDTERYDELIDKSKELRKQIKQTKEEEKAAAESTKQLQNDINQLTGSYKHELANIKNAHAALGKSAVETKQSEISAQEKLINGLLEQKTVAESLARRNDEAKKKVGELDVAIGNLTEQLIKLRHEEQRLLFVEAERDILINNLQIEKRISNERQLGLKTEIELQKDGVAQLEERIKKETELYHQMKNSVGHSVADWDKQKEEIQLLEKQKKERIEIINQMERKAEIEKAFADSKDKYALAEENAQQRFLNGLIEEEEMIRQINFALLTKYNDLDAIADKYKLTTGEIVKLREETAEIVKLNRESQSNANLEKQGGLIESLNDKLIIQKGNVEEIAALEKKRAWEAIANTEDYKHASEDVQKKVQALFEETYKVSVKNDPWTNLIGSVQDYGSQVAQILSAGLLLWTDTIKRETDELKRQLEERYQMQLKALEERKQLMLYEKGFVEAATEEQHQRELELAIEAGDQQRLFQAHSNHEKWLIEQEYEKNKKELDEQAARDKAALDHKVATAEWQSQLLQAAVGIAQSIIQSFAQLGPLGGISGAALMTALGTLQLSIIAANKPKLQRFESGGIVAGNSFSGDNMLVRANSGEMFLTKQQQKNMFDAIDNNELNREPTTVVIPVYLDGKIIAQSTAERINSRQVLIKQGSIV